MSFSIHEVAINPCRDETAAAPVTLPAASARVDGEARFAAGDDLLVRRIDWRFLLPDPRLGRVLYYGPSGSELLAALCAFSEEVVVYQREAADDLRSAFDLAVAVAPSRAVLQQLSNLLAPGGSVYVEGSRARRRASRSIACAQRGPCSADDLLAACRSVGLADACAYWHWPNVENCLEMIPLRSAAAMDCALARRSSDWRVRWRVRVVSWLGRHRWWSRIAPSFSVVASRTSIEQAAAVATAAGGAAA